MKEQLWIYNLSTLQFVYMALVLLAFVLLWLGSSLFAKGRQGQKSTSKTVYIWLFRVLLLGLMMATLAQIANLSLKEFWTAPLWQVGNELSLTPLLLFSLLIGVLVLVWVNRLLKSMSLKLSERWHIDIKAGRQIRRFLLLFLFLLIGGIWLQQAGTLLSGFFSDTLFTLSNVNVTLSVVLYALLGIYGISVALRILEVVYMRHARAKGLSTGQTRTVFQIMKYLIWLVGVLLILDSIGISINMIIAGSAALLVGLGFGIQGLFNDFVSGLVLLFEGSIRVDDVVEIESGMIGRVLEVGLRTSRLVTRDNIIVFVPNHKLVNDKLINWSTNEDATRFAIEVGVAYGSEVRLVERLLRECAEECDEVVRKEETLVLFTNFGDSSLDFRLLFWVRDVFRIEPIKSKLRFAIDEKFRANEVSIPFPQRDVHIK
ncbi:mechanosensitive ion channel family protein [Geofilum rhodophaeum]|uniref:mechanosensitive ion channel family protein n=1 Tax=Geofilum rhodophaeum TaxID=1965019 RepID=UPI000B522A0E|nr:mechanosensitive ion channel domain-containing protein [Geofilum rhodophaeum]